MKKINLYDVVKLKEDVPDSDLKSGMVGTVIDVLNGGAWLVEFEEEEEKTGELVTAGFAPEKLSLVTSYTEMRLRSVSPVRTANRPKVTVANSRQ